MAHWKYKVDIQSAIATFRDLDPHEIDVKQARRTLSAALRRAAAQLPPKLSEEFSVLAKMVGRARTIAGIDKVLALLYDISDQERIWLSAEPGPRDWMPEAPKMGGLEDVPLPPDIPRPEMWDTRAVVQAVKDGFTFLLPFIWGESLFSQNAYYIHGVQAGASGLTVGPEHTPEIEILLPFDWIKAKTFFPPEMVPEEAWLGPPNENGVVAVYVEIDPDTIDWEQLNRGHQIRVRR